MEKFFKLKGKTLVCIDWANVHGWYKSIKCNINPESLFKYLSSYNEIYKQSFYFGIENGNQKSEDFQEYIKSIGFNLITKEVKFVPVFLENQNHFKSILLKLKTFLHKIIEKKQYIDLHKKEYDFFISNDQILKMVKEVLDFDINQFSNYALEISALIDKPFKKRKCDFDCEIVMDIMEDFDKFDALILFSGDGDYADLIQKLINKGKQVILVFARGHKGKEYNLFKGNLFQCDVENIKKYIT